MFNYIRLSLCMAPFSICIKSVGSIAARQVNQPLSFFVSPKGVTRKPSCQLTSTQSVLPNSPDPVWPAQTCGPDAEDGPQGAGLWSHPLTTNRQKAPLDACGAFVLWRSTLVRVSCATFRERFNKPKQTKGQDHDN
jgi:hypothetical protein